MSLPWKGEGENQYEAVLNTVKSALDCRVQKTLEKLIIFILQMNKLKLKEVNHTYLTQLWYDM